MDEKTIDAIVIPIKGKDGKTIPLRQGDAPHPDVSALVRTCNFGGAQLQATTKVSIAALTLSAASAWITLLFPPNDTFVHVFVNRFYLVSYFCFHLAAYNVQTDSIGHS